MDPVVIRADPETRLPPRSRRSFAIVQDTRAAWAQTALSISRQPAAFAAVALAWGAVRVLCLRGLEQAHLGLGGAAALSHADLAGLLALAILADAGPVLVAAALMPRQLRAMLDAPSPATLATNVRRAVSYFGAVLALALAGVLVLNGFRLLPLVLLGPLGPVSTILTMILLLPLACAAEIALFRLFFGLPAVALGLRRPLAEGWAISHGHVLRCLAISALALLPVAALAAAWLALAPDPLGWAAIILRPVIDTLLVSLTASLAGLFYRAYRLPLALRPDLRPSRNRGRRREPVFQ